MNKLVWIVEDANGVHKTNYSTGTKIYTKLHNAKAACWHYDKSKMMRVVEYALVPTGNTFTREED